MDEALVPRHVDEAERLGLAARAGRRSPGRSSCRAPSLPADGRHRCRSAHGPAPSCRGRCGRRSRRSRRCLRDRPGPRSPADVSQLGSCATNAASSSRQRRSSFSRPFSSRPMTGIGRARNAAAKRASAPPALRSGPGGAIERQRLGSRSTGREPLPTWLRHASTSTEQPGSAAVTCGNSRRPSASRSDSLRVSSRSVGSRCASRSRIGVKTEHGLERRQPALVHAERALQRIAVELADQVGSADDDAGLRPPEKLVAAERHQIGAGRQGLPRRRLVRQSPGGEIDQRAAAEIDDVRERVPVGESGQVRVGAPRW